MMNLLEKKINYKNKLLDKYSDNHSLEIISLRKI